MSFLLMNIYGSSMCELKFNFRRL